MEKNIKEEKDNVLKEPIYLKHIYDDDGTFIGIIRVDKFGNPIINKLVKIEAEFRMGDKSTPMDVWMWGEERTITGGDE